MSKTFLHIQKGKLNNGFNEIPNKLRFHARRHNHEVGYFKNIKIKLREKELNKSMLVCQELT